MAGKTAGAARRWAGAVAVAAGSEVLAHRLANPAARTLARFSAALALLGIARTAGVSWAGLGLGRDELGGGARTGVMAGACAAAAVAAGAALPATRGFFIDERAAAGHRSLAAGLARITFAAVPPEELTYRSALLGLRLEGSPPAGAVAWSSVLFGLSHVLPTLSTMDRTALSEHLAHRPLRRAAFVAGNIAITGAAGAAFAWLRLRSGSVLAPMLAHAALNDSALVVSSAARPLGREPRPEQRALGPFSQNEPAGIVKRRARRPGAKIGAR